MKKGEIQKYSYISGNMNQIIEMNNFQKPCSMRHKSFVDVDGF